MGTVSGRAWFSALALMVGAGPAFAQNEPAALDPMTVRRVAELAPTVEPRFDIETWGLTSRNTAQLNGRLYFPATRRTDTGALVQELWVTDGTARGTRSLSEWLPPSASIDPSSLRATSQRLFFVALTEETGFELWTSDGTREGTHLTRELNPGLSSGLSVPAPLIVLGDSVLFAPSGISGLESDLWKSDGTEAGTVPVKDLAPGASSAFSTNMVRMGDTVFFSANGTAGAELWRTDGTEAGTFMVRDIYPGVGHAGPRELTVVGGTLYFSAEDGQHGRSLWKSDGTEAGTVRVADFPRPGSGDLILGFTALGDTLYFLAYVPEGIALWRTDGTEAGTVPVTTLTSAMLGGSPNVKLMAAGSRLYVVGQGGSAGDSLWVSDGTAKGTVRLPRPAAYPSGFLRAMTPWEGGLAFILATGAGSNELWVTDGTPEGTTRRTRLPSGRPSATPAGLVPFQGALLTAGGDAWTPNAVWRLEQDDAAPTFVCPVSRDVPSNRPDGTALLNLTPQLRTGPEQAWIRTSHLEGYVLPLNQPVAITYQAEDATGRIAYCNTVTVSRDLTPPAMNSCPTALTVNAQSPRGVTFYYPKLGIVDETSPDVLITYSPQNGSMLPLGTTQVNVTAKDASGNESTCSFPVTVRDSQAPSNACKVSEVRVEAEGPEGAHASWPELTPVDSLSSKVTVTSTHASGDLFPLGLTRVQVVSTDEAGNSSTCEIQVRVRDSRPPMLTCPEEQTLTTAVMTGTRAEYPEALAEDSVSATEISYSPVVGTPLAPGLHTVQVTAVDAAGNAALCSFHVTVQYDPTSDMRQGLGCSVGSGPSSALGWVALLALAWTLGRRVKDGGPRG